ncbi:MAG TPA: conjugal transfer protein TraH [Candidatus Hydrogenedentes bacterium]|nr:conjugal transfer protein TraH [Candidatus Hydrogenedentota bacterium]
MSETAKDEKGDYANAWLTCAGKEEAAMKTTLKSMFPWNNDKVKKQGTPGKSTTREAAALAELSVEDTQWMESLLGTYHTQSQDGVTTRCAYEKPTVKMSELLEGGEIELLICAQAGDVAGQCLKYGRQKTTVVGYKQKVRAQIQAIYEKNKANPATGLEGAEKTFVERTTVPIQHWTRQLATLRNDNVAAGVISEISDIAAVEYAFQTVEYYINILEGGISNGAITSCDKGDPAMTQQIADVRSKRSEEFEKAIKDMQSKNEMNQFLAKIFRGPQQDTAKKLFFSFDLNKKS